MVTVVLSDMNKADVKVDINPNSSNGQNVSIVIHNTGRSPATNLKVSVNGPENITYYEAFTTDDINLIKIKQTRLLLNANKLIQGDGSEIFLKLLIDAEPNIDYIDAYSVFAVFDQSSSKGTLPHTELGVFHDFLVGSIIAHPIYFIIVIAIITTISITILRLVLKKRLNEHALREATHYFRKLYKEFGGSQHEEGRKYQAIEEYLRRLEYESCKLDDAHSKGIISDDTYEKINRVITEYKNKNL